MTAVKRLSLDNRDRLIIALQMHDIVREINLALRVRKITLTIDFTHRDRMARLNISMPGVLPMTWMTTNPRTKLCLRGMPNQPELFFTVNDIHERLAKYDSRLVLLVEKPPGKKAIAKLQVQVGGARTIVLTLMDCVDGKVKHDTEFQTPDGETP